MEKEEILRRSQLESKGKPDELENYALGAASRVGMVTGAAVCVLLVLVSRYALDVPELALAGWMVLFAMQGSGNLTMYRHLKTKKKLVLGLVEVAFAIVFAVATVVKAVM